MLEVVQYPYEERIKTWLSFHIFLICKRYFGEYLENKIDSIGRVSSVSTVILKRRNNLTANSLSIIVIEDYSC